MSTRELIDRIPVENLIAELQQSESHLAERLDDECRKSGVLLTFCILSFLLNIALLAILFA